MAQYGGTSANNENRQFAVGAIIFGLVVTVFLTLITAAIISLVSYFTAFSEGVVVSYMYYLGMLCAAAGSAFGARRANSMGWLHGGIIGLLYAVGSIGLSYVLVPTPLGLTDIAARTVTAIVVGMLGGIIGVNL